MSLSSSGVETHNITHNLQPLAISAAVLCYGCVNLNGCTTTASGPQWWWCCHYPSPRLAWPYGLQPHTHTPALLFCRDGKWLTLREVFESLRMTGYDLNVDTLDMHADKNTFHRYYIFSSRKGMQPDVAAVAASVKAAVEAVCTKTCLFAVVQI